MKQKREVPGSPVDAVIISIHRALLSGGKLLLLVIACSKAESSLAPQVPSLGLLPSTQELTTAIACSRWIRQPRYTFTTLLMERES